MTEIWNLSTLCRCCHSDGCFKKLNLPYQSENSVEIYEAMLQEALGIKMLQLTMEEASYMICDDCIKKLRDAVQFRLQVLACEQKFKEYCTNEQFLVKTEVESNGAENDDIDVDEDIHMDDDYSQKNDEHRHSDPVKEDEQFPVKTEVESNGAESYDIDVDEDIHRDDDFSQKDDEHRHSDPAKEEITTVKVDPVDLEIKKNYLKTEEKEEKEMVLNKNIKTRGKKHKPEEGSRHTSVCRQSYLKTRLKILEMYTKKEKSKNEVTYSCNNCDGTYRTKRDIFKHIKDQHYSRCKCEQCGKHFKFESQLESHVKSVHGKTYSCQHCGRKYDNKYRLTAHEKTHTNQDRYQCDICQKVLRYKTTIRKHILQHNSDSKGMLCDFCGRAFTQKSNLESHIKSVHLKLRPFSCSICNKTYTAKKHVKYHMKIAHSGNPKPYQCDLCTKSFACPKSFKIHRLTHDNHFACRYCSLVFNNKSDIEIHTKSHTKQHLLTSPFSCHVCGKILLSKFTLNRHLEIHSGVKRFACNICGAKFTQKSLVKRHHLRKHDTSVKIEKVKCHLCKKLVRDLGKHMEIHDADKRKYFCDMCGKNYPTNNALNRHKQHKHYGLSYDCDVCGKQYIKKGSLKTHKLKVHKIKKEIFESDASVQNLELTNVVT